MISSRSRAHRGFTLIELLTVITIICILMAMLFPFITGAKESARKQKANTDIRGIVHAVEQYNVEYGQYPRMDPNAGGSGGTDASAGAPELGASVPNSNLFNILRAIDRTPNADHIQNPRRVSFMDTKAVSNPNSPRDGFLDTTGAGGQQGAFYDPWGTQYIVVIDTDSDNTLNVASFYQDFSAENAPRAPVGSFSAGKDKMIGKKGNNRYKDGTDYSDDLVSWTSR